MDFNSQMGGIRYLNFLVQQREGFEKKNDYLSFVCDFPRKDYFYSGNSQIVAVFQIFFTAKVGGKCPPPLLWMKLSQIKNINPSS